MSITETERSYLSDMDMSAMEALAKSMGEPRYRGRQLFHWIHSRLETDLARMSDLPKEMLSRLSGEFATSTLENVAELSSADGMTRKGLLRLPDGQRLESVLMQATAPGHEADRYTVCVSSQVGCALACSFCVTGQVGFGRQLCPGEIAEQVYYFERRLRAESAPMGVERRHISSIVFMGMGEPLANYESVMKAIRLLVSPEGFGLGARGITVSTAGLVPGIAKLADEGLQLGLAVSLHAPTDEVRSRIMPVNRKYPIPVLLAAATAYAEKTGRRVTYEYAMMDGVNDSPAQALQLAHLLTGRLCHVNLIPLNQSLDPALKASSLENILAFQKVLAEQGVPCTIRQTKGQDILAACGQLRYTEEARTARRKPQDGSEAGAVDPQR